MSLRLRLSSSPSLGLGLKLSPEPHPGQARAASLLQRMQMAGVQMDARSYAVTLSALLKARAEPEALRITRAILDRLEEQEQEQEQGQGQGQGQEQGQGQAWVPWSRRKAEGAAEGAGGRRRPPRKAPLRVDAALCNVMLQVVMRAGEKGEERRVLSRLRAAGLKPSVRTPSLQQPCLA